MRQLTVPIAGRPRVAEVRLLRKAGEHPSPPNARGRSGSPAHAEGRTPTRLAFHPSEDDKSLKLRARRGATRLASLHHKAGGHPSRWPLAGGCSRAA
jgi:hypothetical protein